MHLFEVIIEDSPEAVDFCYIYNFLLIVIICCPLKSFTIGIGCHFQKFVPIFDLMVEHKNFQLKKSIKEYFIHTKLHLQSSDIRSPQSYAKNGFPTHMLLLLRLTLLSCTWYQKADVILVSFLLRVVPQPTYGLFDFILMILWKT